MLDTQDAQVMPLTCRKHFCEATVSEARGDLDTRPGLWFVGRPPGWGVPFCTDTGAPAAVCPVALPALWFPAWVLEQFSRIECHKSFKLEEWIIFFRNRRLKLDNVQMKVPGEDKGGLVFPSLSLPLHNQTEALDSIHRKTRRYCKDGMFWVDECSNETMMVKQW